MAEIARLAGLAGVGGWLLSPFFTGRQVGAGDARWYADVLADYVTQVRHGGFPVFVGQTSYAFNGAVYPLRVAPLYQHLAGFADFLTGRSLGFFVLQHACVVAMGFLGLFSAYATLAALMPSRRWMAAGLACLYLSCPGVLGTIFTQDLYMTWMTVPFVPLVVFGLIRTYERDGLVSQGLMGASLAALWWGHSPVALWLTGLVAAGSVARLAVARFEKKRVLLSVVGGAVFLALAQYPFVSVATLGVGGAKSAVTGQLEEGERIVNVVHEVFPAVMKPVSAHAVALSDLQLGYALWAMFLLAAAASWATRKPVLAVLAVYALLLLVLLNPVPGVTDWLWGHLPDQIKRITFYWPMHRFYLILAGVLTAGGALAIDALARTSRAWRLAASALVSAGCLWSLWEARQFVSAGYLRTAPAEASARALAPENVMLMNHSYGLFEKLPSRFGNGVVDPMTEVRLIDAATGLPVDRGDRKVLQSGVLAGTLDANPGIVDLQPTFSLQPGVHYELAFDFLPKAYQGTLQLAGTTLFREYALPKSGERLAFGTGPQASHVLGVWTTRPEGDTVAVRYIPDGTVDTARASLRFAGYTFSRLEPEAATARVVSLEPFRAEVRPDGPAWLETPRMYLNGYQAVVDGRPASIRRSDDGTVWVAVDAKSRSVALTFVGPLSLRLSYAAGLLAWAVFALAVLAAWIRPGLFSRLDASQPSGESLP